MVDILNKKGFVKIGVGAGFIIAITVLLFFSSSLLTQIAAPTDLSGNMVDSIGGNQGTSTNKPVLIDVTRLGDEGNDGENDETGESEEDESDDDNNDEPVFISGGFFGGGGGGIACCPPPTHKVCDYGQQACVVVQGPGDDECTTDEDCYCDPKTPGYWENHLSEAEGLLDCVHDNYDVFDDVENQSDITYVLECSGNCSNMFNKLKKFLLATILNICADYFDLDDAYDGETIEYWIGQSVAEVENGESEMDEYYKDALDAILNGDLECNPESHTVCNYIDMRCDSVVGSGDDECVTYEDCIEECIPPYLEVDKTAEPIEVICEEVTITLEVSGEGEICDGFYPVDVVLVFDNSGSMDDDGWDDNISDWQPIGDAKIAAKAFADLLGTNDKAALVSFNTVATLEQGLTFDKNIVKSAIDGMSAGGWTNMSQGIDYGTQELVSNGRTDTPWIEILLSDGNNNCGMKNPPADCHQRVFDSAQEAADNGIVIYTIALGNNSNQSLMQDIANITGGKFYYAPDSEDLQEIYEEIAEEVTTMAGTNIVVIDYLPSYVELNESTLPPECVYDDIERKITCELDDLHINETVTITFNIYLHQFGYILTNVYPDSGVEYLNYNGTTVFEEFPETYVTSLDCDHTVCNYINMTCDTVLEPGDDECVTFDDCAQHTVCDYIGQVCAIMEGAGDDECSDYSDCFHTECAEGYCIDVQGVGDDQCETDSECRHHECNYVDFICEEIFDIGTNECQTFQDCPQHKVCDFVNELCIIAEGSGDDECQTFDDCYYCGDGILDPGEECEIAGDYAGWGPWGHEYTCKEDNTYYHCVDCQYEHVNECNYYCSGDPSCDGIPPMTYLETCTAYGYDYLQDYCNEVCELEDNNCEDDYYGCTSEPECDELEPDTEYCNYMCQYKPLHTECNYQAQTCELVASPGTNECETFEDCPQHRECDYQLEQCVIVEGSGDDECLVWEDCYYCGDGTVTSPEECELPETDDNEYCSQTTSGCSGHKLGVRDSYGFCDEYCGCIDDLFSYSCVEGECGAECDEDSDCPCPQDGCIGPDYYDYPDYGECTEDCMCDVDETPCDGPCKPTITPDDPRCTHYECDYIGQACVLAEGEAPDECSTYMDCIHTECNYVNLTCDIVEAPGIYECIIFSDCPQHTECDYIGQACIIAEGEEADECITYSDCLHTECNYINMTCDLVETPGIYECETFSDCPQHTICDYVGQACVIVEGEGKDECSTYDDCIHTVCSDMTCITNLSPGTDECDTDEDCYYYTCQGMSCVVVPGFESDECADDSDCTDYICNYDNLTCDAVAGSGYVECETFEDCPQHSVCDFVNELCIVVEGAGDDECQTFDDCYYCGDGVLDPGEECEIAGDYAGWGPWGHEYTCKEDNTYYHCVDCQYEHVNECNYYCSGDFECDGIPPMTYLETCTAYGYDYLQDYCNEVCELEDNNCEDDYYGCTSEPECDELEPDTGDCNYMCEYKPLHAECNYQTQTCDLVASPGVNECQTFEDCP